MRTPSAHHIEGFFQGMEYAEEIANRHRRGGSSVQAMAIRKERTTLALAAARPRTECRTRGTLISPLPPTGSSPKTQGFLKKAALAFCTYAGEAFGGLALFALFFLSPWVYLALTGQPMDFGGAP